MEQTETNLVIEWYIDLEKRLEQFLQSVPIEWNHNAVLPLLAGIITDAGGLIDSIFRKNYIPTETKKDRKHLNINDFRKQFETKYSLSTKRSLLYQHPPLLLTPFLKWSSQLDPSEKRITLSWWNAYNKIKHERIDNYKECTLLNAVDTMCSLHQILSIFPCFSRPLIEHDMISLRGYSIPYALDCLENDSDDLPFLVESKLFATPYGANRFPDDIKKISGILFGGSKKLERFVGK